MTLADEKEALATIFFECARYERPSTEWIAALDLFTEKVAETERKRAQVLITECRKALAEELAGWDIDPPLAHVKQAHDHCDTWLRSNARANARP